MSNYFFITIKSLLLLLLVNIIINAQPTQKPGDDTSKVIIYDIRKAKVETELKNVMAPRRDFQKVRDRGVKTFYNNKVFISEIITTLDSISPLPLSKIVTEHLKKLGISSFSALKDVPLVWVSCTRSFEMSTISIAVGSEITPVLDILYEVMINVYDANAVLLGSSNSKASCKTELKQVPTRKSAILSFSITDDPNSSGYVPEWVNKLDPERYYAIKGDIVQPLSRALNEELGKLFK